MKHDLVELPGEYDRPDWPYCIYMECRMCQQSWCHNGCHGWKFKEEECPKGHLYKKGVDHGEA